MEAPDAAVPGIKELRDAIPKHCFQASNIRSFGYIVRDLVLSSALVMIALTIDRQMDGLAARFLVWMTYGVAQGMVMTGIWILAHECGHQALFTNRIANDSIGFVLHSMLLVPYFSWKYSHGLHHRYANNMEKDTAFVPFRKSERGKSAALLEFLHLAEDTPLVTGVQLFFHQVLGWPAYLLFMASAGEKSLQGPARGSSQRQSHFDPMGHIFTAKQHPFILMTDIGLALMLSSLYYLGTQIGFWKVFFLFIVPYIWVNHWIVAITYLHHTHPLAHHYEAEQWNFRDGAIATVDREFGWIGKHIFHGIIEFHVIHHLFARIPFYHAEEATEAIKPMLGDKYLRVETSFLASLWNTFKSCRYVEPSKKTAGALVWAQS